MILLILALLFGIIVFGLLVKSFAKKSDAPKSKLFKVLKMILFVETVAFIALFVIVLIKTLFM